MEEKRINSGYEIIESHTIGSNELVIGHNPEAPNPYVCWYCKNGSWTIVNKVDRKKSKKCFKLNWR